MSRLSSPLFLINWKRLAVAAPVAALLNTFLLFTLFMNPVSKEIIFSESIGQSPKLVGVWNTIEPVPSLASLTPALMITPLIFTTIYALVYNVLPGKNLVTKGFSFGIMLWSLIAVFFELFTPYGLFGEPLHLLAYELFLWFIGLVVVSIVIAAIYRKS
jgi:hypothetical protein